MRRLLTAGALLAAFLAALFLLSPRLWEGLLLLVAAIGAAEWAALCRFAARARLVYVAATPLAGALVLAAGISGPSGASITAFAVLAGASLFWCAIAPLWLGTGWKPSRGWMLAAVGWIVLLPTVLALSLLRAGGPVLLLTLMAVVWVADSAAYFAGRAFGRHKLAPLISPGKTWEGVAGAIAGVTLYGFVAMALGLLPAGSPRAVLLLVIGLWAMVALSVIGDLLESWMKRQAGVKDSGRLLPGHGGVLDRIDALTASLPPAALVYVAARSIV